MTTSEFIKELRQLDPSGNIRICLPDNHCRFNMVKDICEWFIDFSSDPPKLLKNIEIIRIK